MKNNKMSVAGLLRVFLCGSAALFGAAKADADNGTWNHIASGDWNDTTKWVGGVVASGKGAVAYLTSGVGATVNQNVPGLTLGNLVFAHVTHTITNNAITLDNNGIPATITVSMMDAEPNRAVLAVPLNGTGGLTKQGSGWLDLSATYPGSLGGTVTVDNGTLSSSATNGAPFGTGSIAVNGGRINVAPAGSGQNVSLTAASGDVTNTFTYSGAAVLSLAKGANSSVTLTLGNAGAATESVLTRANSGVLIVAPSNGTSAANLGIAERVLVNGGVSTLNGMVSASIAGRNNDSEKTGDFLTYGANGFEVASYTEGLAGGATSIANVSATTATDSANVYALRVNSGTRLTINSGKTLTVGDGTRPACLILNTTGTQNTVISNSVLDFGTSEGIIYFNGKAAAGPIQTTISSTLAGQNGITLAGLVPDALIQLNAASGNLHTGGTRILSGRVIIPQSGCLGNGDLTIFGHEDSGGQLFMLTASYVITNALHISGLTGYPESASFGAIRIDNGTGTRFTGPVDLLGDTRISASQFTTIATFSGPISGPWRLECGGDYPEHLMGTMVLTGTNTYTGGTIIRAGTLKLGTGGTLGTGPVENRAKLVFDSATTLDFTNTLSGAGTLTQQGAGTLKLRNTPTYAGPLILNSTLDLCGVSTAFGALSGIGRVINPTGPDAVLTVGSANTTNVFAGQLTDGIALVKTGTGTLTLFNTNNYSGTTTVSGGMLKLGNGLSDIAGLSYRLDATALGSLTLSVTNVTAWADADGRSVTFTQAIAAQQPVYVTNAINGLPALRFGADSSKRLVASKAILAQTVFIVNRMTAFTGGNGIWGQSDQDYGIRAKSVTRWQHTSNGGNASEFSWLGEMYINGVAGTDFTANAPHILTAISSNQVNWTAALGHYYTSQTTRYFRGEIGEVLVFDRVLGPVERQSVVGYLSKKWLNGSTISVTPNLLPIATGLTLAETVAFDLNGVDQTVASLAGAGTVRNSNVSPCTLTIGSDNASTVFAGVTEGALSLVKTGSGTLTINGYSTATGATVIQNGTLMMGAWLPTQGLSYRLDATDAATITLSSSNVTAWADSNGSALKFTQANTALQPVYLPDAINGRPAVRFGVASGKRLVANMSTNAQTVFIVYRMNDFADANNGIWGKDNADYGIRATGINTWQHQVLANNFTSEGEMYIDGVPGKTFSAYQPHVLTAVSSNQVQWTTVIGHYWLDQAQRYFRGDISEVLVYDRKLPVAERKSVETYLNLKWLGSGVLSRLATNAIVTVASGATLDLNGQTQTLSGLAGSGSVINGTVKVTGQIAPGGDGTVGALTLPDAPDLTGTLRIDVRANGTCDQLVVAGDLDVAGLALVIADTGQLKSSSAYTIATCTGDLTGSFTSDNLPPKNWSVRYIRTPGAGRILLAPRNGLVFSLR